MRAGPSNWSPFSDAAADESYQENPF